MNALIILTAALTAGLPATGAQSDVPIPPQPEFATADAAQYGTQIASYADLYGQGWTDEISRGRMTLFDAGGDSVERTFIRSVLEGATDGDKNIIRFMTPAEIRGVAALTHENPGNSDDNWLYLPSSKRVRRISGANKAASFQGTEFTYEDLSTLEVVEYDWKYLDDAELVRGAETLPVYRVEARPNYEETGYSRIIVFFHRKTWRQERIEYFDKAGVHLKTQDASAWQHIHGRFWRAARFDMTNHQTGKRTLLESEKFYVDMAKYTSKKTGKARKNMTDAQFSTQALQT